MGKTDFCCLYWLHQERGMDVPVALAIHQFLLGISSYFSVRLPLTYLVLESFAVDSSLASKSYKARPHLALLRAMPPPPSP